MKFSSRVDIAAPADAAFAALTDFDAFERAALLRGVEVTRGNPTMTIDTGASWSLRFRLRNKMRRVICTLDTLNAPADYSIALASPDFNGAFDAAVIALARERSRLQVHIDIRPKTLKARLLIQSLRLNRSAYEKRFDERVRRFAEDIELRHTRKA